jgi:hypothetical protein
MPFHYHKSHGLVAQLARALPLQGRGLGFKFFNPQLGYDESPDESIPYFPNGECEGIPLTKKKLTKP